MAVCWLLAGCVRVCLHDRQTVEGVTSRWMGVSPVSTMQSKCAFVVARRLFGFVRTGGQPWSAIHDATSRMINHDLKPGQDDPQFESAR